MIISDKQELRRCVKQLVRRADVCEASLSFDFAQGEIGVEPMLDTWARPAATPGEAMERATAEHTPFSEDAMAMLAALDAMDMPVGDLDRAQAMEREYTRAGYLREVLDTLRAKCVLVRVPMDRAEQTRFEDDRLEPLMTVSGDLFIPGRYGVDYAGAARAIAQCAQQCGARNLAMDHFDAQALRYCVLPVCQDEGLALHVQLNTCEEIDRFALLLDEFDGVRALAMTSLPLEPHLIEAAVSRVRLLVCLGGAVHLGAALRRLGTRFAAYSAKTAQPEMMLGRWLLEKEGIWQALCECYLPLARTGYTLRSDAIERDVRSVLSGNLLALCRPEI